MTEPFDQPLGVVARDIADAWINEGKWARDDDHAVVRRRTAVQRRHRRFMRTLKEQCLYLHRFPSLAEARRIIGELITQYNTEWLIERLGHQTPVAARIAAMAA